MTSQPPDDAPEGVPPEPVNFGMVAPTGEVDTEWADKWRPNYPELAYNYSLLGATDARLSMYFGVSVKTIGAWRARIPQFAMACARGKHHADAEVAHNLYRRACGFFVDIEKIVLTEGKPFKITVKEYVLPDVTAGRYWLNNRQPDLWSERKQIDVALTGGKPKQSEELSPRERVAGKLRSIALRALPKPEDGGGGVPGGRQGDGGSK